MSAEMPESSSALESASGPPETATTTLLEAEVVALLDLESWLFLTGSVLGGLTQNFFEVLMVQLDDPIFNAGL